VIDLREHFGIWDRCGNTRFFKKQNPWSDTYLNPIDGLLVSARRDSMRGDPRYTLVVKDATKAEDKQVKRAFEANEPWVQKAVEKFFYLKGMGWAIDAIRRHGGAEPVPGDADLYHFLSFYKSGGERYRNEGGSGGTDLMLEEVLEAILRTMGSLEKITVDYGRNLTQEDLDEALGQYGILECR